MGIDTFRRSTDTEILVVGAGPTGLTLACELLRRGSRCRVIDGAPGPSATSKAFAIHASSLEIFHRMEIADKMVGLGQQIRAMEVVLEDKRLGLVDFSHIPSRFPFILSLPQSTTEALLCEQFVRLGGQVEWGTSLEHLHQAKDGVATRLVSERGTVEAASFPWVVGADGSQSTVRKILNVPFEGSISDSSYIVADGRLDWNGPRDRGSLFMGRHGYVMIFAFAVEGRHRVVLSNADNEPATVDTVNEQLRLRVGRDVEMSDVVWLSAARYHRRLARTYRQGHVFLAGDAAHIHSPVGGQGLNTGIQDAYNLAWKVAAVHSGQAPMSLLDSYEQERRPVAERLLRRTDRMTNALTVTNSVQRTVRKWIMPFVARSPMIQSRLALSMAGLDVAYRPDTRRRLGRAGVGRRAPDAVLPGANNESGETLHDLLRGKHATLLLFSGISPAPARMSRTIEAAHGTAVRSILISWSAGQPPAPNTCVDPDGHLHRLYDMRQGGACLVRPDGYIGYRCGPANEDKLRDYLAKTFGIGIPAEAVLL